MPVLSERYAAHRIAAESLCGAAAAPMQKGPGMISEPFELDALAYLVVDSSGTLNRLSSTMPKRPHSGGFRRNGQGHMPDPLMLALR
ncbi:hypothetical protein [Cupriavidus pauculus]|uniref:hypothetical protein n=1 Tax=Cupriavidus pauculus TaxID=82633 RepID=UPI003857650B